MKTVPLSSKTEAELWMRILHPNRALTPRVARVILGLSFPESDVARMRELSAKARAGTLTSEEDAEANEYERAGSILSTLKSKARQLLKQPVRTA